MTENNNAAPSPSKVYVSFGAVVNDKTAQQLAGHLGKFHNDGVSELVLALNTPGGSVDHGLMIYNLLRGLSMKVTTFNIGAVNSIGNAIFLAGEERFSVPTGTFLFHGVGMDLNGQMRLEEKNLTEHLETIRIGQQKIADVICGRTSIEPEEMDRMFYGQETKNAEFALEKGIINDVRDFIVPAGVPFYQLVFN